MDSTGDVVPYLNKCIVVLVYDPLSILLWTSPFFVLCHAPTIRVAQPCHSQVFPFLEENNIVF